MVTGVLRRRRGGRRGGDLRDRRALVTGASGGLGEAIARRLHAEGARLVLSARRTSVLEGLAAELGDAEVVPADLGRVEDAVALSERAGGPDVLVANAGLPATGNLLDLDVGDIRRAVDLNVCGTLVLTGLLLPAMVERGWGHVLLVGSLAGLASTPRSSVYNSSKFALRGFGHALREELRDTGVGVSLVRPTFVSGAGCGPTPGCGPRHPQVSLDTVADACLRAVREDPAEVLVAPALRVAVLAPELMQPVLRSSVVPPEVLDRQRSKR